MKGLNKCLIIGCLGNDPETRVSAQGTTFANISIATDESYKDKQTGQMVPKTEWHRATCAGKLAEICRDYLKKGSKVYIEGKLETRKWQDNTGADRYSTEIKFFTMQMLDNKEQGTSAGQATPNGGQYTNQQGAPLSPEEVKKQQSGSFQAPSNPDPFDDDIPF